MTPGVPDSTLEVALSFRASEAVSGAELPAVVTLRNNMPKGGLIVDSPQDDCPFEFTFEPENQPPFRVSRMTYLLRTRPQPPLPREHEAAPLPGGSTLEYPLDLAGFLVAPLEPGTYRVSATYPLRGATYRSPAVTLRVVAPRVQFLELARDGNGFHLGAAMIRAGNNGSADLLHRESEGGKPALGYFRSREVLRQPTSLAISTDAEGTSEARWLGWTEDGKAGFARVWGTSTLQSFAVPSPGANARLLSPGWSFEDGSALFLAAAPSGFTLIALDVRTNPKLKTYPASAGLREPAAARAGLFRNPDGQIRILVVWPDGRRLICSILDPHGEATPPRVLIEAPQPFVAVDIESVAEAGAPVIDAVSAAGREGHLVRIRGGEANQTAVLPPVPDHAASPLRWTVCAGAATAVAIQAGETQIFAWHSGAAAWQNLNSPAEAAVSHLRLVHLSGVWAVWADSSKGIQLRQIAP